MSFQEKIKEIQPTSLYEKPVNEETLFGDVIKKIEKGLSHEQKQYFLTGLAKQKNKTDINIIKEFFDLLISLQREMKSKNSDDKDTVFFNLNKRIFEENLIRIKSILALYEHSFSNEKIMLTLLGTIIQYIHETESDNL